MKRLIGRHKSVIVFALTLILIGTVFANLWRLGFLSTGWLTDNKDALSALSSILTMFVISGGALFSYYTFFRGRTLSLRAQLSITVTVHETDGVEFLHVYTLTAKNVGTSTIWEPVPTVRIVRHGPKNQLTEATVTDWISEQVSNAGVVRTAVIEPGETVSFFGQHLIDKSVWAVTFKMSVRDDTGHSWFAAKTVSNKSKEGDPDGTVT